MPVPDRVARLRKNEHAAAMLQRNIKLHRQLERTFRDKMIAKKQLEEEIDALQKSADEVEGIIELASDAVSKAIHGEEPTPQDDE